MPTCCVNPTHHAVCVRACACVCVMCQPGTSARFELFVAGVELANAYSELNDPAEQRSRFASQAASASAGDAEAHVVDEPYCRALEVGLPPTGGWGMGVDRLVTLLTRTKHIRVRGAGVCDACRMGLTCVLGCSGGAPVSYYETFGCECNTRCWERHAVVQ